MAWLAVHSNGNEIISRDRMKRFENVSFWTNDPVFSNYFDPIKLPKGTIEKILGYPLTWKDDPVEIK